MEAYQGSIQDPSVRALDLRGKHTWEEVIREARNCESTYLHAGTKWPRKMARSFSANAEAVQPWIRLIPNDMFLAALSGGLKLVFSVST